MLKKIAAITILALLISIPVLAKEGTHILYGAVHHNGQPIAGATVSAIGEATYTTRHATTNKHGIFIIDKLPADEYILRAIGNPAETYKPTTHNIILKQHKKEVNFDLKKR